MSRAAELKAKHLILLSDPFSLSLPYADRQRIVIVPDEQVEAERRLRAGASRETHDPHAAGRRGQAGEATGRTEAASGAGYPAIVDQQIRRSLHNMQDVAAGMKQRLDDQSARLAVRRRFGTLMISRTEAAVLRLDRGHPLRNILYVGHPAKPDLYFPAAEFHRRVFEHKFIEAVTLLTSLGASRIVVQQEDGHSKEKEWANVGLNYGFTRKRSESSRSEALFEAEYPGTGRPVIPDDLYWYPDEPTWQMIARARMQSDARKTSLAVTYTSDYGIDRHVVQSARTCGINVGGKFEEQRDIVWRLDAEFPSLSAEGMTRAVVT
jgi:hypothetical protein